MRLFNGFTVAAFVSAAMACAQPPSSGTLPTQNLDWRFADPGAQLIGGVDVKSLLESPLVKSALDQTASQMGPSAAMMQMVLGQLTGVTQVYFSITGRKDDTDALIMIKGTLDDAAARAMLQGAVTSSATAAPATGTATAPLPIDFARVDADTILLGKPALLSPALRRMQRPASTQPNPLLARAAALAAGNDFWIAGSSAELSAVAPIVEGLKGLALGLSLQRDFRLRVSLDMATAEVAQRVAAQVQKSVPEIRNSLGDLDANVDTNVEGATLRVAASISGDWILKRVAEKTKGGLPKPGALFGASAATPASAPSAPPKPPDPRTVKIYGLDDGPKEVPLPAGQH